MIEVFKTNVEHEHQAMSLRHMLAAHFPLHRIDFDVDDSDRILRVEGGQFAPSRIIELMTDSGYNCDVLE